MSEQLNFDWSGLAFGSKKPLESLDATFIAAPRELSPQRLRQLIKTYLPKGNIVLGLAKENFIDGFDGQPQFRTLQAAAVSNLQAKISKSQTPHRLFAVQYFQRETNYILEKVSFRRVVFVRGSWYRSFHHRDVYYTLANRRIDYELVSPFVDETEAKQAAQNFERELDHTFGKAINELDAQPLTAERMLATASLAAKHSFDYTHQTGAALGGVDGDIFQLLATSCNRVVPYQTYAMHHGSVREWHFSPANDLNHYDTVHAEVELVITAQKQGIDLHGTTLFINLLPCPTCCRMLCETDIERIVYSLDHSAGYSLDMFARTGKSVAQA